MTKETRGGKRQNAGRKPEIINPVRFEMFVPKSDMDKIVEITGFRGRAKFVREAIADKLAK